MFVWFAVGLQQKTIFLNIRTHTFYFKFSTSFTCVTWLSFVADVSFTTTQFVRRKAVEEICLCELVINSGYFRDLSLFM